MPFQHRLTIVTTECVEFELGEAFEIKDEKGQTLKATVAGISIDLETNEDIDRLQNIVESAAERVEAEKEAEDDQEDDQEDDVEGDLEDDLCDQEEREEQEARDKQAEQDAQDLADIVQAQNEFDDWVATSLIDDVRSERVRQALYHIYRVATGRDLQEREED